MSAVSYNQPANLTSYRTSLAPSGRTHAAQQHMDPMTYLYSLEREISERRTASMMQDLIGRLDTLEGKVENVSGRFETINRELEKAVIALAQRVNTMESGGER